MHTFIYNGKKSQDYNLILSGEDTWKKTMPDVERMQIPGRNGDLLLSNHRYSNVELTYHVGIKRNFNQNFTCSIRRSARSWGFRTTAGHSILCFPACPSST